MSYIILTAGILTLFIGFVALKNSDKKKETMLFSLFCFITSIWIISNFFLSYLLEPRFLGFIYAAGTFVSASLLSWTYIYVQKGNARWKHVAIYLIATVIAALSLFTNLIIAGVGKIEASGLEIQEGIFFPLFAIFLSGSVILSLVKIFLAHRRAQGAKKKKIRMILVGIAGFTVTSIFVSSILPMFGIFSLTNFDSPSALIFAFFTFLAITKYRFLEIKIILAHFFVATLIILSALDIFVADMSIVFRIFFFLCIFIAGMMLLSEIELEVTRKEELEIANTKLKKLDKIKSEFISVASHQLRTPLSTIKGFISVMKAKAYGDIPKGLIEPIEHIESANERLVMLVEEMLNISQLEMGKLIFDFKVGNINDLAEELFHSFGLMAKSKKLKLEMKLAKNLPNINMDYSKMREVVSNVIDNAIKYTEKGSVTISTKRTNSDAVEISVCDTGIGISANDINKVFDKFARGKKAQQLKKSGVGLGMYFSKKIVDVHKGKISATSKGESKGSKFTIELPIVKK